MPRSPPSAVEMTANASTVGLASSPSMLAAAASVVSGSSEV